MAQFQSILGDESPDKKGEQQSNQPNTNVAEFTPQTSKPGANYVDGATTSTAGAATATARTLYDQAKETAGQAYDAVADKAAVKLDETKSNLTEGLSTVAGSVRQVGDDLSSNSVSGIAKTAADYTGTAARKIEGVASYLENHDVREMARDLEGFARRNPAIFLGAAFGLGFLAARFFKSSPRSDKARTGRAFTASAGANRESTKKRDSSKALDSNS
jgi:hypothetical protein